LRATRRLCLPIVLVALIAALAMIAPVRAVEPDEVLSDPKLEARARDISAGLRCLVCQNQSIDDSHAPLARDLRKLVRERLVAGDTDQGVRDYIVQRYGEFVLLKPPLNLETVLLWLAPALLLIGGAVLGYHQLRPAAPSQAASGGEAPLSPDEQRRLDEILKRES
jgi:cytochrome c-type biogenesis protein CcmH